VGRIVYIQGGKKSLEAFGDVPNAGGTKNRPVVRVRGHTVTRGKNATVEKKVNNDGNGRTRLKSLFWKEKEAPLAKNSSHSESQ